jgi:hypothetical protein
VANQAEYQIASVAKIRRIWDEANRRELQPMTMAQYRALAPQAITASTGLPTFWIWESYSGTTTPKFDLFLYPTPSSVITLTADITSVLTALSADGDIPILPVDFHDLIFLGALEDEYRHLDDSRASTVAQSRREREAQFKYWMHETGAGSTMLGSNLGWSSLGPAFPSGT